MNVQESVALVTGANRGIGTAYVEALIQVGTRHCAKVQPNLRVRTTG